MVGGGAGRLPTEDEMKLITRQIEVDVEVDGVTVKGRVLSCTTLSELRDKNYKLVGTGKNKRPKLDELEYGKDLFIAAVIEWDESVVDEDGKPLKCDEKNKSLVYEWNQGFAQAAMNEISKAVIELRSEEVKN